MAFCTEHCLNVKRYVTMTVMWTIILVWLALQLPLAVLIGKSIKFGTVGYKNERAPSRTKWYDDRADNSPLLNALVELRQRGSTSRRSRSRLISMP